MKMKICISAVLAGALAQPALGCDLCAIYSATEAQGGNGQGFFGGVAEQFTEITTVQDSGHKIASEGQYIDSSVSQVFAGYNFNDRFSLQLNLPVIYRGFGSDTQHGSVSGIGDLSLTGNYKLYEKLEESYTFNWTVLGGVKFPTGDSSKLNTPDEDLPEGIGGHDLALGSGSFDGIVGTGAYGRWKRGFFTASVQYAIRSEGDFHHQYANDLTWFGGPGAYVALTHDYTLALQAVVSGETKGKDTFSGVDDPDSAETLVYVGPQITFTWRSKLSAQLAADLPVYRDNSGVQVLPDYRIRAAFTWRF
jgi:hypothetical protein